MRGLLEQYLWPTYWPRFCQHSSVFPLFPFLLFSTCPLTSPIPPPSPSSPAFSAWDSEESPNSCLGKNSGLRITCSACPVNLNLAGLGEIPLTVEMLAVLTQHTATSHLPCDIHALCRNEEIARHIQEVETWLVVVEVTDDKLESNMTSYPLHVPPRRLACTIHLAL